MKKILLLLTLIALSFTGFSQKKAGGRNMHNFNFDSVNKKIYWQKVYNCGTHQEVLRFVTDMGCIISHKDSLRISGSTPLNNLRMPKGMKKNSDEAYEGLYRPIYFDPCTIYFSIDIKDDKYRVTVTNMIWTTQTSFIFMGVVMNAGNLDINSLLIRKNGKLRIGFRYGYDFTLLNYCLDIVFDIKRNSINITEKEW